MAHRIDKSCTKCGACLLECPTASIIEGINLFVIDADTCKDHASCVAVCPVDAIHPAVKKAEPASTTTPTRTPPRPTGR